MLLLLRFVKTIDAHPHPWFVDEKGKANGLWIDDDEHESFNTCCR
jgi:hypothetical protein